MTKKFFALLLLFFAFHSASTLASDTNKSCNPCAKPKQKKHKSCDNRYVITKKDFMHKGTVSKTFVIKKPGNYCLAESIDWYPQAPAVADYCNPGAAIIIDADNVTLDLNGYVLNQANGFNGTIPSGVNPMIGILVKNPNASGCNGTNVLGHTNVTIVNGSVTNFSYVGIYVQGGSQDIFLGNDDTQLLVTGCGYGSLYQYWDTVSNNFINPAGLLIGETFGILPYYNGPVQTVRVVNTYIEQNGWTGCTLGIANDVVFENTSFSRNFDTRIGAPFDNTTYIYGFQYFSAPGFGDVDMTYNVQFNTCYFDENTVTNDTAELFVRGMIFGWNHNGLVIQNGTFNANSASKGLVGSTTIGCAVGGGSAILIDSSEANNNFNDYFVAGFHNPGNAGLPVTNIEGLAFRHCMASGNECVGTGTYCATIGLESRYAYGVTIEDCIVLDNTASSTNPNASVTCVGISVVGTDESPTSFTKDGVVTGCHVAGNTASNPNPANENATGISIGSPSYNFVFNNNVVQDNTTTGTGLNAGIWLQLTTTTDTFQTFVVENNTIENQQIGIFSNGDKNSIYQYNTITDVDFGILLETSSCNSVNNNYVTNAGVGFQDDSMPSTSLFSNNRTFGATTPFDVTYVFGPVPVVSGSLATGFPSGAEVLDNVAMAGDPICRRAMKISHEDARAELCERIADARKMIVGRPVSIERMRR